MQNQLPQISGGLAEGPFRDLIMHTSNSKQVLPDMPLMGYLGGFDVAINGKFVVVGPNGHEEQCNLYLMPIGESGERKSSVVRIAKEPHNVWLTLRNKEFEKQLREARRRRKYYQSKIAHLNREASKLDEEEAILLLDKIAEIEAKMPKLPIREELFFDDATVPALKRVLVAQSGILANLEAEPKLAEMLLSNSSSGLNLLCNAYDGEEIIVDRVKDGRVTIPCPSVSLCPSFQPEEAVVLMRQKRFRKRGLAGRFLYVLLTPVAGYRSNYTPSIPKECLDWYHKKVQSLLDIPLRLDEFGNPDPYRLELDDEASWLFQNFWNWAEAALQPNGPLAFSKSWGSKLPGKVKRIAAVLHCVDSDDPTNTPINGRAMRQAIAMAHAFVAHAQALYHQAEFGEHLEVAREIMNWALSRGIQEFSAEEARKGTVGHALSMIKKGIQYLLAARAIYEDVPSFADEQSQGRRGRNRAPRYKVAQAGMPPGPQQLALGQ